MQILSLRLLCAECVSQIPMLKLNCPCDGVRRRLSQESKPFINGIKALVKQLEGVVHFFLSFIQLRTQHSKRHPGSRQQPSSDSEPADPLVLDFPASRMLRNKFLFFIHDSVSVTLLQQLTWTKMQTCFCEF